MRSYNQWKEINMQQTITVMTMTMSTAPVNCYDEANDFSNVKHRHHHQSET